MSDYTVRDAVSDIREYLDQERKRINEKVKDDPSYIATAREIDHVIDQVDRRCRIAESKSTK